jgi:hypothetical protein
MKKGELIPTVKKHIPHILLAVFILAIFLLAPTSIHVFLSAQEEGNLSEGEEWLEYEDQILGIKIDYPSFFEVNEEQNEVTFRDPVVDSSRPRFVDVFTLIPQPEVDSSEKLMRKDMNELRNDMIENVTISEASPGFAGSSSSASRVEFLEEDPTMEDTGHYVIYFLVDGGIGYEITFYTQDKDYSRDAPIFK